MREINNNNADQVYVSDNGVMYGNVYNIMEQLTMEIHNIDFSPSVIYSQMFIGLFSAANGSMTPPSSKWFYYNFLNLLKLKLDNYNDVHPSTVMTNVRMGRAYLKIGGITTGRPSQLSDEDHELILESQLPAVQIANQFQVRPSSIRNYIKKHKKDTDDEIKEE